MIEAGILDGDLVIVQQAQDARNGEIVVALAGADESADEATVKTFYRENGRIRLQPENAALEPIYADYVAGPRTGGRSLQGAVSMSIDGNIERFARTLDQELTALLRGCVAGMPRLRRVCDARPRRRRLLSGVRHRRRPGVGAGAGRKRGRTDGPRRLGRVGRHRGARSPWLACPSAQPWRGARRRRGRAASWTIACPAALTLRRDDPSELPAATGD